MKLESRTGFYNKDLYEMFKEFKNFSYLMEKSSGLIPEKIRKEINILSDDSIHIKGGGILPVGIGSNDYSWDSKVSNCTIRDFNYAEIQYTVSGSGLNPSTMWLQMIRVDDNKTKFRIVFNVNTNCFSILGLAIKAAPQDQVNSIVENIVKAIESIG